MRLRLTPSVHKAHRVFGRVLQTCELPDERMDAARTMTYLRLDCVSTLTRASFACARQHLHSRTAIAVQSNYTSHQLITPTAGTVAKFGIALDRQHHQQQKQQIASCRSYATMPTPTATRVAIIGAGTVGATIAFSLIGMFV